jgi:hypothetical protein
VHSNKSPGVVIDGATAGGSGHDSEFYYSLSKHPMVLSAWNFAVAAAKAFSGAPGKRRSAASLSRRKIRGRANSSPTLINFKHVNAGSAG